MGKDLWVRAHSRKNTIENDCLEREIASVRFKWIE
jgi:hypothetical protein